MAHNKRQIELETYLDGEMSSQEKAVFETALGDDTELQAELDTRRADRREFQLALGEDIPASDLKITTTTTTAPQVVPIKVRRFPISRVGIALAACLCLAILTPRMLRNDHGAEGPGSPITMSGQVTVVRFGEIPGQTTVLEAGAFELPAGFSR